MLINVTGGAPDEHWKRVSLLSTVVRSNSDVFRNCFREPIQYMVASLLNYQLDWDNLTSEAAVMTRRATPIDELPGRPSSAHLAETLYAEWGHQCLGQTFWIETWKFRSRWALSQGAYVALCDAESDAEKEAVTDICEHPIVVDALDQRFKEGLSYLATGESVSKEEAAADIATAYNLLSKELSDLFSEHSLKLA